MLKNATLLSDKLINILLINCENDLLSSRNENNFTSGEIGKCTRRAAIIFYEIEILL